MKQICVKIEESLLNELDNAVAEKPYWIKRNTAIRNAIRNYINASRGLPFDRFD